MKQEKNETQTPGRWRPLACQAPGLWLMVPHCWQAHRCIKAAQQRPQPCTHHLHNQFWTIFNTTSCIYAHSRLADSQIFSGVSCLSLSSLSFSTQPENLEAKTLLWSEFSLILYGLWSCPPVSHYMFPGPRNLIGSCLHIPFIYP